LEVSARSGISNILGCHSNAGDYYAKIAGFRAMVIRKKSIYVTKIGKRLKSW
jgi:hypothetical protein